MPNKKPKPKTKKAEPRFTAAKQARPNFSPAPAEIFVKGARMHNLKNIDVRFPRQKLIVVTGVSGSGKSSLTMDTLFAEGQRRYAESLSSYARQFFTRMEKPDLDYIKGLCPAIAIEQKVSTHNSRSTVGSMTEIADYLRLLFARIGRTYSPVSGREVKKDQVSDVVDYIQALPKETEVKILVPFQLKSGRNQQEELQIALQKGFSRLYIPKSGLQRIEDFLDSEAAESKSPLFLLIDRFLVTDWEEEDLHRMADSIETAFEETQGACLLEIDGKEQVPFLNRFEADGIRFEEPSPNLFSYNNPYGACPKCEGFGKVTGIDPDLVIPDKSLSVYEGAVAPWSGEKMGKWRENFILHAPAHDFPIHRPISELNKEQFNLLWKGNHKVEGVEDFFRMVEENLYKIQYRVMLSRYRGKTDCPECMGTRLRPEALYVKIGGLNIAQCMAMPVHELHRFLEDLQLSNFEEQIAHRLLLELKQRLETMDKVGLAYLSMDRLANTLSGGESQRIHLTKFLGSPLTDSLYILDEPSIGLHPRDTARLIEVLQSLRDLGNTVVVVEHDEAIMRAADHIIDMGPLASHLGGEVIGEGSHRDLMKNPQSLTGQYLSGKMKISTEKTPRPVTGWIHLEGAHLHNLKSVDLSLPLGQLTVVSGVSGSGKTSLIRQTLYPALQRLQGQGTSRPGPFRKLHGDLGRITQIEMVDQNPIGKSSRSNPVTYIKAWDEVRKLMAQQPLARQNGLREGSFSFNVDGGRCDTCKGEGEIQVDMQFLSDIRLTCETCKGKRFKDEVLAVKFKGKNVYDILNLSVDQALDFFSGVTKIHRSLEPLSQVGLGYIRLGQSASTLSGGEAQRVKLAYFLGRGAGIDKKEVLFIFDEPTTGLHFHDIEKLLGAFHALLDHGHTVLVIEHHTDLMRAADWLIDLGPEAGANGGRILYAGPPEGITQVKESQTGAFI